MGAPLEFRARCAKCNNRAFDPPAELDLGQEIACSACGHRAKLVEFADLATLDAIVDILKKRAIEALHGVRFKLTRVDETRMSTVSADSQGVPSHVSSGL